MDASKSYADEIDYAEQKANEAWQAVSSLAGHMLYDDTTRLPICRLAGSIATLADELVVQVRILRELVP